MNKVFILTEDGDIVAAFSSKELAIQCAEENNIRNFHIHELTIRIK
jgi:hypothetical protein